MKLLKVAHVAYAAGLALAITSCAQAVDNSTDAIMELTTDEEKASYGIGYGFAANILQQTEGLDLSEAAIIQGVKDAMAGTDMSLTEEEVQASVEALQKKQMEISQAEAALKSKASREAGAVFLAENAAKDEVTTTESGLQYEVLSKGDSEKHPTAEDTVRVHYHGTLIDGTVFDSSVERGEPVEFPLGNVIAGWTEGVQLMVVGDKFRFVIPADLAYGDSQASPVIAPGSTLIFEVELLDVI